VSEQQSTADLKARLWWITMIRGFAALGLGIGLSVWRASTTETLLRFMALYWLSSGVMSLVRAIRGDRRGRVLFLVTGIVGIVGGLLVLVHPLLTATVSFATLALMFGIVAILAGRSTSLPDSGQAPASAADGRQEVFSWVSRK
jgi:uncharacterized membrane protein HdeD (DUF308 family)